MSQASTTPPTPYPGRGIRARSRFLIQSIRLEEKGPPGALSTAMLLICGLILAAIVWAMFTTVDEVAVARGEVVPAGSIHSVQHLEGGIVAAILVREGDMVEAEQPLLRLAPSSTRSDLNQMLTRRAALLLQAERLRAFAEDRQPDFDAVVDGFEQAKADQRALFNTQVANRTNQVVVVQSQFTQEDGELQRLTNRAASLREQGDFLREELEIRRRLLEQG
ncbi:MAG: HlyD family type I secretion periplasmic adaptor subunit, partial [Inquilinus sp.]|nr:HlyD family type I secretion periplasmic adaptor subunit [Inquilinus sp.]